MTGRSIAPPCAVTGDEEAALRSIARGWVDEKLLARLIEAGQKKGRFRASRSAADLARMLVVVQQGVSTLARAGAPSRDLERAVDEALAHVIG